MLDNGIRHSNDVKIGVQDAAHRVHVLRTTEVASCPKNWVESAEFGDGRPAERHERAMPRVETIHHGGEGLRRPGRIEPVVSAMSRRCPVAAPTRGDEKGWISGERKSAATRQSSSVKITMSRVDDRRPRFLAMERPGTSDLT